MVALGGSPGPLPEPLVRIFFDAKLELLDETPLVVHEGLELAPPAAEDLVLLLEELSDTALGPLQVPVPALVDAFGDEFDDPALVPKRDGTLEIGEAVVQDVLVAVGVLVGQEEEAQERQGLRGDRAGGHQDVLVGPPGQQGLLQGRALRLVEHVGRHVDGHRHSGLGVSSQHLPVLHQDVVVALHTVVEAELLVEPEGPLALDDDGAEVLPVEHALHAAVGVVAVGQQLHQRTEHPQVLEDHRVLEDCEFSLEQVDVSEPGQLPRELPVAQPEVLGQPPQPVRDGVPCVTGELLSSCDRAMSRGDPERGSDSSRRLNSCSRIPPHSQWAPSCATSETIGWQCGSDECATARLIDFTLAGGQSHILWLFRVFIAGNEKIDRLACKGDCENRPKEFVPVD